MKKVPIFLIDTFFFMLLKLMTLIYLGTFSKYISPSINVGYILSNSDILKIIYSFKESFDLCTSLFTQLIALDYLQNNNIKNIINNRIMVYKKLLDDTIEDINKNYAESILSYSKVKGGLFIHIKFKNQIDSVIFETGNNYYIDKNHSNETRINICSTLIDNR